MCRMKNNIASGARCDDFSGMFHGKIDTYIMTFLYAHFGEISGTSTCAIRMEDVSFGDILVMINKLQMICMIL